MKYEGGGRQETRHWSSFSNYPDLPEEGFDTCSLSDDLDCMRLKMVSTAFLVLNCNVEEFRSISYSETSALSKVYSA